MGEARKATHRTDLAEAVAMEDHSSVMYRGAGTSDPMRKAQMAQVSLDLKDIPFDIRNENELVLYFDAKPIDFPPQFFEQFNLEPRDADRLGDEIVVVCQKFQAIQILKERLR